MATALGADQVRNVSHLHVACLTFPDNRIVTTNAGVCQVFLSYFQVLFIREHGLITFGGRLSPPRGD